MIPELPKTLGDREKLDFYETLLGNLEDQSTLHLRWHTHRQNPAVCWICDLPIVGKKILEIADRNISKSPLDMETELSSEDESDFEIGNSEEDEDGDQSTYNEPEYDTEVDER